MGVSNFPVRIMVDATDVELAQSVLDTYIADDEEPPDPESAINANSE